MMPRFMPAVIAKSGSVPTPSTARKSAVVSAQTTQSRIAAPSRLSHQTFAPGAARRWARSRVARSGAAEGRRSRKPSGQQTARRAVAPRARREGRTARPTTGRPQRRTAAREALEFVPPQHQRSAHSTTLRLYTNKLKKSIVARRYDTAMARRRRAAASRARAAGRRRGRGNDDRRHEKTHIIWLSSSAEPVGG